MASQTYKELLENDVYAFGSEQLLKFEKQLTKYFDREYKRYAGTDNQLIDLGSGPIALAAEDLADDHYNEGIPFFENFLDSTTMSYTMAYYDDDPALALKSKSTLAEAEVAKFEIISKRMRLKGDEKLLNFGCGFGYFESFLLHKYPDIKISGLTHSKDQYDYVLRRMDDPDDILSNGRFEIFFGEICDESVDLVGNNYDIVSSMGLMEQINNVEHFFRIASDVLVEDGRMFHHLIVSRDLIPQLLDPDKTLIGDYFPGGKVLPFYALQRSFENFELKESWFLNGMNYWRTLDAWHENFWKNMDKIYPDMMDIERVRYWNNYFVLCKAMFFPDDGKAYGNCQYLFYKTG